MLRSSFEQCEAAKQMQPSGRPRQNHRARNGDDARQVRAEAADKRAREEKSKGTKSARGDKGERKSIIRPRQSEVDPNQSTLRFQYVSRGCTRSIRS